MTKRSRHGGDTIEGVEKKLADGRAPEEADGTPEAGRGAAVSGEGARKLHASWIRFLERREIEGYCSAHNDRQRWRHIETDVIAELPLASVTRRDVLEWMDRKRATRAADRGGRCQLSNRTIQSALNLLREALEMAR